MGGLVLCENVLIEERAVGVRKEGTEGDRLLLALVDRLMSQKKKALLLLFCLWHVEPRSSSLVRLFLFINSMSLAGFRQSVFLCQ